MSKNDIEKTMKNFCVPRKKKVEIKGWVVEKPDPITKKVLVSPKLAVTSDDRMFYTVVDNLRGVFELPNHYDNLLIKMDNEGNSNIYIDNFPIMINSMLKEEKEPGLIIFKSEIYDISGVQFADCRDDLTPKDGERFICVLRNGFHFIFYADISGKVTSKTAMQEIGRLMSYSNFLNFYNSLTPDNFTKMFDKGWFPFIGLSQEQYSYILSNLDTLSDEWLQKTFDDKFIDIIQKRIFSSKYFSAKKKLLSDGIESHKKGLYGASVSTLTPLLEGILNEKYQADKSKPLSHKKVVDFIKELTKTNNLEFSRLLHKDFVDYIDKFYYKSGLKESDTKKAARHSVSHGRAPDESFTIQRSMQVILTLHQLSYYL